MLLRDIDIDIDIGMGIGIGIDDIIDNIMGIVDVVGFLLLGDDIWCCCGREDCVYLRYNCLVLLSVEWDVYVVVKMG